MRPRLPSPSRGRGGRGVRAPRQPSRSQASGSSTSAGSWPARSAPSTSPRWAPRSSRSSRGPGQTSRTATSSWEELNPSKRSITLNLKEERARDLVRAADRPERHRDRELLDRGHGAARARATRPCARSTPASSWRRPPAFGRTGPQRDLVAYGSLLQCFTGWASLSAYPGRVPTSSGGIWTDPLTACMEVFLLLSAIWRQRGPARAASTTSR